MAKLKTAASSAFGTGLLFFFVGLLFFFVFFLIMKDTKEFAKTAQKVQAVVTDVQRHTTRRRGKTKVNYDVYVQYTVNGNTYQEELNGGNGSMREGQAITVYYDPMNPRDVRKSLKNNGMIFAMIFVAAIALIGGYTGIKPVIQSAKLKKLKKTGAQIIAKVTHITEDRSVTINRSRNNRNIEVRYPNKAECEAFDPVTGEKYIFSSEAYVSDLQHLVGQLVTVYYDPNDRSRHYVDLNSAY